MKIAIAGHSGFVGTILKEYFTERGDELTLIQRVDLNDTIKLCEKLKHVSVIINLCGAPIINRWSKEYKIKLIESRVSPTRSILLALNELKNEVHFINASAIGIYSSDGIHSEDSLVFSNDFVGTIVNEWERSAKSETLDNVKLSIIRLGLVIDKSGGFLKNMITPFLFKVGIYFKKPTNTLSFIDSVDLCRQIEFIITNKVYGIVNCVSPVSTNNIGFAKVLRKITKCWFLFALPDIFLKLIFGECFYTLKQTPNVYPKRLIDLGFKFKYSTIEESLQSKFIEN